MKKLDPMRLAVVLFSLFTSASLSLCADAPATPGSRITYVVRSDGRGRLVRSVLAGVPADTSRSERNNKQKKAAGPASPALQQLVQETAGRYEVDPLLVHSVISVESNYNQYAVSPKGAEGLMQLIPSTARRFGAANSFDAKENIEAGVRYLKHLQGMYNDDLTLTLAAYNAGEGAVAKYRNSVPPYRETQEYVQKVGRRYTDAKRNVPAAKPSRPVVEAQVAPPPVEQYRHVEQHVDDQGRIYLTTR